MKLIQARWWWHISLIPALGRQRQADLYEFDASLVYRISSRTDSHDCYTEKPCLKTNKLTNKLTNKKKTQQTLIHTLRNLVGTLN